MLIRKYSCVSILVIFAIFTAGSLFEDVYADNAFLGGTADDSAYGMAQDSLGNIYFVMDTVSIDFYGITKTESSDTANSGFSEIVIIKMDSDLTTILEGTYFGGNEGDMQPSIAIDSNDNIFVAGNTRSSDLPNVSGAPQVTLRGIQDAFVTKLDTSLNVIQTTYLGGSLDEHTKNIDIDSQGFVYVFGQTESTDFPFTTGNYTSNAGSHDLFITKFNNTLTGTPVSTYYGSIGLDAASSMKIDSTDNIFISGFTAGVVPGMGGNSPGSIDSFVVKYNNDLKNFTRATYVGGNELDLAQGLGIDSNGNIFVTGITESNIFTTPTTSGGAYPMALGNMDTFLSKFDNDLNAIQSTYAGGSSYDYIGDGASIVFLTNNEDPFFFGYTFSTDLQNTIGAVQEDNAGPFDVFGARFSNDLTTVIGQGYLGGTEYEISSRDIIVSGDTLYTSFTTRSAIDTGCTDSLQSLVFVGTLPIDLLYTGEDFFLTASCVETIEVEINIDSGGSDSNGCHDCIDPTFYYSQHKIIVKDGFRYNDYFTDVTDKHTATDLIIAPTNHTNHIVLKVYDNGGTDNIKWIDVGFGSPGVDHSFDLSEVIIETKFSDNLIKSSIIKDKLNLIDFGNVTSQIVDCGYLQDAECIEITIPHTFRDSLSNNGLMIRATDYAGNEKYHFINDGVKVIGDSLNELPTDRVFTKKYLASAAEWIDLVRIDRVNDIWVSEGGLEFKRSAGGGFQRMAPLGFAD